MTNPNTRSAAARSALLILLMVPLWGCTTPADAPGDASPGPDEPEPDEQRRDAATTRVLHENHTLMLANWRVVTPAGVGARVMGNNCMAYPQKDVQRAAYVRVEATWVPVEARYERLELILAGEGNQTRAHGGSPLVVQANDVFHGGSPWAFGVRVHPASASPEEPQEVVVHVTMQYDGAALPEPKKGFCEGR